MSERVFAPCDDHGDTSFVIRNPQLFKDGISLNTIGATVSLEDMDMERVGEEGSGGIRRRRGQFFS